MVPARPFAVLLGVCSLVAGALPSPGGWGLARARAEASACPPEMADMGSYCIDRWEVHTVDLQSGKPLSPYYPPEMRMLQFAHDYWAVHASRVGTRRARQVPIPVLPEYQRESFSPRAVSAPDVLPQGYMTHYSAKRACEAAGKRLCTEKEWVRACRGRAGTKHPYGANYKPGHCNVFRQLHPAFALHGNSSLGHLDPRLHLVIEDGHKPLLEYTGTRKTCVSSTRDGKVYDMVGNLDEWIADENGTFVGGFYSRGTRSGCEAKIESHAPAYTDYSLGTRCCK